MKKLTDFQALKHFEHSAAPQHRSVNEGSGRMPHVAGRLRRARASEIWRARGLHFTCFEKDLAGTGFSSKAPTTKALTSHACRSSGIQQGSQQELRQGRVVIDDFVQHGSVLLQKLARMCFHNLQAAGLQDAPTSDDLAQKLKGILLANSCHELCFHFLDQVI